MILIVVIFWQVCFLFMLFPSWMISFYKNNQIEEEIKKVGDVSNIQTGTDIADIISSTNQKLEVLDKTLEYRKAIPLLDAVISNKSNGIKINQFLYTSDSRTSSTVSLFGSSSDRETLVLFVKKLQNSNLFKTVDSPVSNFTKDSNINFSISLTVAS
jgi:hypothetical protein